MRYLFDCWDELKNEITDKRILLFLDYDGTLTPIAETPEKAVISHETRELVRRLSESDRCSLAIISGRALKEIKKIVGINGLIYVGNHGLEIEGPKIKFESPVSPRFKFVLKELKNALSKNFLKINGAFVEDKGLTLSIHYRLSSKIDELALRNILYEISQPYLVKKEIALTRGKKIFEIKPPIRWDKGKACLWLLARQRFILKGKEIIPIYIGDDVTDEDAFCALKGKGLTVFVGKAALSSAKYYLNDTGEVIKFLRTILTIKDRKENYA